jgi:hypothetical protein
VSQLLSFIIFFVTHYRFRAAKLNCKTWWMLPSNRTLKFSMKVTYETRLMKTSQYRLIRIFGFVSSFKETIPARNSAKRFLTGWCNAVRICFLFRRTSSWIATACLLSTTAYLIQLRLTLTSEGRLLWGYETERQLILSIQWPLSLHTC